jgi:hypothetical protein
MSIVHEPPHMAAEHCGVGVGCGEGTEHPHAPVESATH